LIKEANGARLVILAGDGHRVPQKRVEANVYAGRGSSDLALVQCGARRALAIADPDTDTLITVEIARSTQGMHALAGSKLELASGPCALAAVELDRDGDSELAVALGGPGSRTGAALVGVVELDGAIALRELARFDVSPPPRDVVAGDFDGDGRADLAFLCGGGEKSDALVQPFVRRAGSNAFDALAPLECGHKPFHLTAGDLDGDGKTDLAVGAQDSHVVNLWLARSAARGDVSFERLLDLGGGLACIDVAIADLDGDARADIAVASSASDAVSVILRAPD
jgi:hypothetical protein